MNRMAKFWLFAACLIGAVCLARSQFTGAYQRVDRAAVSVVDVPAGSSIVDVYLFEGTVPARLWLQMDSDWQALAENHPALNLSYSTLPHFGPFVSVEWSHPSPDQYPRLLRIRTSFAFGLDFWAHGLLRGPCFVQISAAGPFHVGRVEDAMTFIQGREGSGAYFGPFREDLEFGARLWIDVWAVGGVRR